MEALYRHPDGEGEIFFEAATSRLFTSNDAEGLSAYALIGLAGLRDVAAKLLALAAIAKDSGDLSEQVGAGIGIECLDHLMAAKSQGERIRVIQSAVLDLQRQPNPELAAGGFAVVLVNVIEVGLANLPKFDEVQP